jgi:UDP-glucose 4-epimerase
MVFHAAALKQVPSCEFCPVEAVRTNVMGSDNVVRACEANGVASLVVLSTDKAVYPINAMGMAKVRSSSVRSSSWPPSGPRGPHHLVLRPLRLVPPE